MLGPSGFFCFSHKVESIDGFGLRYSFAYKPPGPLQKGALDDLMLALCQGPHFPDVVVILGLAEETESNLLRELRADSALVAQQRLKSRIPLVFVEFQLKSGTAKMTLLDPAFKRRAPSIRSVVEKQVQAWMTSGLRAVFDPKEVILRAPSGYTYQKPSGSRSEVFLKPDLAFKSSAVVGFVALALFHKLFSKKTSGFADLQTVFVDTMAIAPIAYGLRELLGLCGFDRAFYIESFHSYGGIDLVPRPLSGTSLCLISASMSMALHEQWVVEKGVSANEVVTLLTVTTTKRSRDGALHAIEVPQQRTTPGPAQLSIRIKGETFLPEQEAAKKVLLTDLHHRSDDDVKHFFEFAGKGVFDIYRYPSRAYSKPRALFVAGTELQKQSSFIFWLEKRLLQSVKAATKVIVFQDDAPSKTLAQEIQAQCAGKLGLTQLALISSSQLSEATIDKWSGVIICAAVVGKGSQLLEVSRSLRDKQVGPRLYLIGYQVAETREELATFAANLRHSKDGGYEVARFGTAAIGTQLGEAFRTELETYYPSSVSLDGLPSAMRKRAQLLASAAPHDASVLLPHGDRVDGSMRLRVGFAYWPEGFQAQACHGEVLATIAVLLQLARENEKLSDERRLADRSFRHVVLAPENFSRFNDGVLQAALLRCAYPSELDYRGDYGASDFMKALILRALNRAGSEAGEGILEFLLALSQNRLQLCDAHLTEIQSEALAKEGRPPTLQKAINFILRPPTLTTKQRTKMPF